jgi:hypothetical protein
MDGQLHLEDQGTGNTPNPLFEHDDDDDNFSKFVRESKAA